MSNLEIVKKVKKVRTESNFNPNKPWPFGGSFF